MHRQHRLMVLILAGMALSLALIACQNDNTVFVPQQNPAPVADKFMPTDAGATQAYLAYIDSLSNTYTYETVLDLSVTVGQATAVAGFPPSWGPDYPFSISIPAGALVGTQYQLGETVQITLAVPVLDTAFPNPDVPLTMIMLPHGLNFREPVQVSACRHPALAGDCDHYDLYYVEEDPVMPQIFIYGENQQSQGTGVDCKVGIGTSVEHFSKWHLAQGRSDPPPQDPEDPDGGDEGGSGEGTGNS